MNTPYSLLGRKSHARKLISGTVSLGLRLLNFPYFNFPLSPHEILGEKNIGPKSR